ncbi:MAG: hypothetical protein HKN54_01315 [Flavobacteriaceae bacterium]|nr:hypothetical protein [Flavobacteriaceae bacterium]
MSENKTGRYFKYAIGEIILVIIGILIALWIAEWNNERHERLDERVKLRQIEASLKSDLTIIENAIKTLDDGIAHVGLLDSLLKANVKPINDSLNTLFGAVYGKRLIELNTALYEDLKINGFSLINDDAIRVQLINTFESQYGRLEKIDAMEDNINTVIRPYYLENFNSIQFWNYAQPNDLDKIWSDTYYHNVVNYRLITLQVNQFIRYPETKAEVEQLLQMISEYLK